MTVNINTIETCTDTPECMMVEESRYETKEDEHIGALSTYVIHGMAVSKS